MFEDQIDFVSTDTMAGTKKKKKKKKGGDVSSDEEGAAVAAAPEVDPDSSEADKKLAATLDYKNVDLLKRFITDRGKIVPRRISGVSAPFQRKLTREIKRARSIALLPFVLG